MTYQETLEYLFVKTPAFQQKGESAYKPGLGNVIELDNYYGNPHKKFKTIHIAGTNGKGSVSHTLAAILQSAGYKVGLYTSPHLKDFSERIRVNGKPISEQYVIDFVREADDIIAKLNPSFFEITTLMAFTYFAHENVDVAVIETGLGGRLDSTNIISPVLSVVTNVSFDHVNLLGDTLEKIAFEKAGILKSDIPAVVGEMSLELRPIFTEKTEKVVFAEDNDASDYEFELKGYCQDKNKKTILAAAELLKKEFDIKEENISRTKLTEQSRVIRCDYLQFLKTCSEKFDIIFLDPPYAEKFLENALEIISEIDILNESGIIICEKTADKALNADIPGLIMKKEYLYGNSSLVLYRKG